MTSRPPPKREEWRRPRSGGAARGARDISAASVRAVAAVAVRPLADEGGERELKKREEHVSPRPGDMRDSARPVSAPPAVVALTVTVGLPAPPTLSRSLARPISAFAPRLRRSHSRQQLDDGDLRAGRPAPAGLRLPARWRDRTLRLRTLALLLAPVLPLALPALRLPLRTPLPLLIAVRPAFAALGWRICLLRLLLILAAPGLLASVRLTLVRRAPVALLRPAPDGAPASAPHRVPDGSPAGGRLDAPAAGPDGAPAGARRDDPARGPGAARACWPCSTRLPVGTKSGVSSRRTNARQISRASPALARERRVVPGEEAAGWSRGRARRTAPPGCCAPRRSPAGSR